MSTADENADLHHFQMYFGLIEGTLASRPNIEKLAPRQNAAVILIIDLLFIYSFLKVHIPSRSLSMWAMSRHIRVTLAAVKGMSSSSVKSEYIAVQYWTRLERMMMGISGDVWGR
jgi:hypothetical protein